MTTSEARASLAILMAVAREGSVVSGRRSRW
jgi:hypothetical protein